MGIKKMRYGDKKWISPEFFWRALPFFVWRNASAASLGDGSSVLLFFCLVSTNLLWSRWKRSFVKWMLRSQINSIWWQPWRTTSARTKLRSARCWGPFQNLELFYRGGKENIRDHPLPSHRSRSRHYQPGFVMTRSNLPVLWPNFLLEFFLLT